MRIFFNLKKRQNKLGAPYYVHKINKSFRCTENIDRKLNYSIDGNRNKHNKYFFEKMPQSRLNDEKKYRWILETIIKHKVYRNPKPYQFFCKSPDYWIKSIKEAWDLKCIDGKSVNIIENILGNACKRRQAPNLILVKRNTPYNINKLKRDIVYIFQVGKKSYIKKIMLFNKKDELVLYLER